MSNFKSYLEIFYSKEHHEEMVESWLEIFKSNLSSRNRISKAFVNFHYVFNGKT